MFLHASIVDKPMIFDHVLFNDLQTNPSTKLLFSGHIHKNMSSDRKDGVKFRNPGSLGRPEISENYAKTKPSVLLFQYNFDTEEYKEKILNLKYSLPYDVVFDIDKNNQKKTDNKNTELFLKSVTNISLSDVTSGSLTDDLQSFAKKRNITDDVISVAINTINIIKTGGEL